MLSKCAKDNCCKTWLIHKAYPYINGLVQDCSDSIATALELLQSCTKPTIYSFIWDNEYFTYISNMPLTHWGRVTHKCVSKLHEPSLVQIMVCRLDGAKPLSKPVLENCLLHPWNKLQWNLNRNSYIRMQQIVFKIRQEICGHYVSASMC